MISISLVWLCLQLQVQYQAGEEGEGGVLDGPIAPVFLALDFLAKSILCYYNETDVI